MAPRTRRSMGVGDRMIDNTGIPAANNTTQSAAVTDVQAKRGRGRPPKSSALGSESTSSAPTPAGTISESEYSTPATSNAVTPAPSVSANPAPSGTKPRARLVVELPDVPQDAAATGRKPKGFSSLASTRARRSQRGPNSYVEDSDDDELYGFDPSPSAALARKLQREEDNKALLPPTTQPSSSAIPRRVSLKNLHLARKLARHSSEDDVISAPSDTQNKGKGKALTHTSTTKKRSSTVTTSNKCESEEDDSNVSSAEEDNEDEPLSRSAPARKKQRVSHTDDDLSDVNQSTQAESLVSGDDSYAGGSNDDGSNDDGSDNQDDDQTTATGAAWYNNPHHGYVRSRHTVRLQRERQRLEEFHPELLTMWGELARMPVVKATKAKQPKLISRQLKPFQLEGLSWMKTMEGMKWKGGLLGDEMGLGKTIQAVSLIMSDYPAKIPTLVLVPPVALMQWTAEIDSYTEKRLKTLVFHGTNSKAKNLSAKELKKFDVILMSYNSLESMYRKQEKGFKRKGGLYKEKSSVHQIKFHRVILDEAHSIKSRTTMTAKACFALQAEYRWCLTGTPLQNRIGEFFSLIRFLSITPFASYFCKQCRCSSLNWSMGNCQTCGHHSMRHVSVFNQELLGPIQRNGNRGEGRAAFQKLRLMTDRIMLRRLKKDHMNSMELPVKEIHVDRQFFGEEENDFASSIMTSGQRKFDTYVAQGVLLRNYANIFGLIMQMRQVADHPDLILKKSAEGGQNVLVCCICDEPAEEAIRSKCKHDFCRSCAKSYINSQDQPDCPQCHIPLSIDLEQPEIEQDEVLVKKSSIINRIKMENWTSSSKIELLVHELHSLRSDNASHKSIIFSQFTTMLQLIEWRLRRAGITTVLLDGSMTPAQRQASINHFMTNVDVECFLVSLKAGGVALNLTEASRVFIVDPWWNPAAEWQSADRCHRIGQTRPCIIKRLCIEDSVESRMVLLQEKKTNMINSTINSDDAAIESLTEDDLQFLFRGS